MSKNKNWKFQVDTSGLTLTELEHLERSIKRSLLFVQLQIALKKKKAGKQKKTSP